MWERTLSVFRFQESICEKSAAAYDAVESTWLDELVYALYGLTPEEIKIVEEARK
jgi:hypothetical protein